MGPALSVRLIKSQRKGAKKGRDQIQVSVLYRWTLRESRLYLCLSILQNEAGNICLIFTFLPFSGIEKDKTSKNVIDTKGARIVEVSVKGL